MRRLMWKINQCVVGGVVVAGAKQPLYQAVVVPSSSCTKQYQAVPSCTKLYQAVVVAGAKQPTPNLPDCLSWLWWERRGAKFFRSNLQLRKRRQKGVVKIPHEQCFPKFIYQVWVIHRLWSGKVPLSGDWLLLMMMKMMVRMKRNPQINPFWICFYNTWSDNWKCSWI